jgi:hypothetical protein
MSADSTNQLGVFGDSFASKFVSPHAISGEPWVNTLCKLLKIESTLYALHGTSIWWSYCNFLKHYKKFSHIVFVYSQHNRWHHLPKEYETMHHITTKGLTIFENDNKKYNASKILLDAYPIVNSEELDLYIYQKIFHDVNQLCRRNDIKLINFMPFDNGKLIDYSTRSGFCIYNAKNLTGFEQTQLTDIEKIKFTAMLHSGDLRYCHMNWKNNGVVARRMYENINNTTNMVDLLSDKEISSDPECIRELLTINRPII